MAVEAVSAALSEARTEIAAFAAKPSEDGRRSLVAVLENAVKVAHQAVFDRGSKELDKQGMGTTLDVVLLAGAEAFVAHVGDSRTYLVREGKANQITTDHTVAEVLVIEGKLSAEEAQVSPLRTILVNAVGVAADVGVEMAHVILRQGDRILLCSDGLHDYFPTEQEIAGVICEAVPADALHKLISTAKNRGGHDNITGVILEVLTVPASADGKEAPTRSNDDDAVPHALGSEDTQPVVLSEVASGKPGKQPRGVSQTEPAPVATADSDATTAENPLPDFEGATMPMKQIPATGKKKGRKKPKAGAAATPPPDDSDDG
jgi:PPM family protein phosphatase